VLELLYSSGNWAKQRYLDVETPIIEGSKTSYFFIRLRLKQGGTCTITQIPFFFFESPLIGEHSVMSAPLRCRRTVELVEVVNKLGGGKVSHLTSRLRHYYLNRPTAQHMPVYLHSLMIRDKS
jgi:hypothetical protein